MAESKTVLPATKTRVVYRQLIISLSVINMGYFFNIQSALSKENVNIPVWHEAGYMAIGTTVFHDDIGGILPVGKLTQKEVDDMVARRLEEEGY